MIVVIDGIGANTNSVCFAIDRLGLNYELTDDVCLIQQASHVILPGVGTAEHGMTRLKEKGLVDVIQNLTVPTLGICLGMQMLFAHSEEGDVGLLNIINANISKFYHDEELVIPHMGWNIASIKDLSHPLFKNIKDQSYFYYVHSFCAEIGDYSLASCLYGKEFSCAVQHNNFYGVQFHPERSGKAGEQLLKNFFDLGR